MNQVTWNKYVQQYAPPFGAFLQSWEWGEFQRALGRQVQRIYQETSVGTVLAQAVKLDLAAGQYYWYIPKGPLGSAPLEKQIEVLRNQLSGGVFYRLEPGEETRLLQVKDMQPAVTSIVDLSLDEEKILADMKSKTRYNVRLAARKGVVSEFVNLDYFEDFVRLMDQTTKRDKFAAHPAAYYRTMLEVLGGERGFVKLAVATFEDRPIAANIIIDFSQTRTYLHGATSNLHRNVMAQYHLHWFLMQNAKQKKMDSFDFWGIAPEGSSSDHPWFGITRYKKGFGGQEVRMPGTFELPTKHIWYSVYRLIKKIRK